MFNKSIGIRQGGRRASSQPNLRCTIVGLIGVMLRVGSLGLVWSVAGLIPTHARLPQTSASRPLRIADSLPQIAPIQVIPHQLRFDPQTTSATFQIRNVSTHPVQATVQLQFAYMDWPHGLPADTTVIYRTDAEITPRDTVVVSPPPTAHFAGRWLSGVPTVVSLAAGAVRRFRVQLTPPKSLAAGEYWARLAVIVRPSDPHRPGGRDVRQTYAMPMKGHAPLLQDTCQILYRQGPLHMGLVIGPTAMAVMDTTEIGDQDQQHTPHMLFLRLPTHLVGNAPFVGQMHSQFRNLATGETVNPDSKEYGVYADGVQHWAVETDVLAPGTWEYTVTFDNDQSDVPPDQRIPMTPVHQSFRFQVKPAWAY